MPSYPYIPRMPIMGGNPWQSAASAYGSDLDQLNQLYYQGQTARANAPMQLYQQFMQGYQNAQNQSYWQQQQDQQQQLADAASARADAQERRNQIMDRAKMADFVSKNLGGTKESYDMLKTILGDDADQYLPAPQEKVSVSPGSGDLADTSTMGDVMSATPGQASISTQYPMGTAFKEAQDKLAQKAQEAQDKIQARFTLARMKADAAKDLALDPSVAANQQRIANARKLSVVADQIQARLDAGDPEATVLLKQAQAARAGAEAGLAGSRSAYVDTQTENYGQITPSQQFAEEQKNQRAANRAAGPTTIPAPRPNPSSAPNVLEQAKAEFNALPVAQQTPENKAKIKQKYGIR